VITQSGAAQGLAVLAPLRGSFTSFACLTDRRGWHILCRPAFRPRPAGSPGRLILFSAADCLLLIATSLPGSSRGALARMRLARQKKAATFDRDSLYKSNLNCSTLRRDVGFPLLTLFPALWA